MTEWNRLAPEAIKLGLKVKVHSLAFESRAVGERRLARWSFGLAGRRLPGPATKSSRRRARREENRSGNRRPKSNAAGRRRDSLAGSRSHPIDPALS